MTSSPVTAVAPASSAAKAIAPSTPHMQPMSANERPGACAATSRSRGASRPRRRSKRRRTRARPIHRRASIAGSSTVSAMLVTVRLFAMLRERAGTGELELDLPEGARVGDALAAVSDLADGLPLVMAVNRRYAQSEEPLSAGDELALIPPVSGGAI